MTNPQKARPNGTTHFHITAPTPRVELISMPWPSLTEPSLGLGILKAKLSQSRIQSKIIHLNLLLRHYLSEFEYEALADSFALNDFLFSATLDSNEVSANQIRKLEAIIAENASKDVVCLRAALGDNCLQRLLELRTSVIPDYLASCLELIDAKSTLIGFTCLYDQTFPSLALGKLIKQRYPHKLIVLGGYGIERPVGTEVLRCFSFIDAVAFGDGEDKIELLALASVGRIELGDISGIVYRDPAGVLHETGPAPYIFDLDASPIPDFDDWFRDFEALRPSYLLESKIETLPVESSRGCWWGQKSHCVFCGIDDETMRYRQKSPHLVKKMLAALRNSYNISKFRFSDYILPKNYYTSLLPDLASEPNRYSLQWEIKSNLHATDVSLMKAAGIKRLQPGIESFSSSVLKKMAKGVSGIQNILTIKLLTEARISIIYNILYGFPMDELSEYEQLVRLIPEIYHLQPPEVCMPVATVRYAPLQQTPKRFGINKPPEAHSRYQVIFSDQFLKEVGFEINNYCYNFETLYENGKELERLYSILRYQVSFWISRWRSGKAHLSFSAGKNGILFKDSRETDQMKRLAYGVNQKLVYLTATRSIRTPAEIVELLKGRLDFREVEDICQEFEAKRLIAREGNRVVGLALPHSYYS